MGHANHNFKNTCVSDSDPTRPTAKNEPTQKKENKEIAVRRDGVC